MPLLTTYASASRRGFAAKPVVGPYPQDKTMSFSVPTSWSGSGTTMINTGSDPTDLTISGIATYTAGPPAYISNQTGTENTNVTNVTPNIVLSTTNYSTLSIWAWVPSVSYAQYGHYLVQMATAGFPFDGIYIALFQGGEMGFTTNGAGIDKKFVTSTPVWTFSTWQMITFVYIASDTLPSKAYLNATEIGSFVHGSDTMNIDNYYLEIPMYPQITNGGRWNNLNIYGNTEFSASDVSAKFAAERGYYGV